MILYIQLYNCVYIYIYITYLFIEACTENKCLNVSVSGFEIFHVRHFSECITLFLRRSWTLQLVLPGVCNAPAKSIYNRYFRKTIPGVRFVPLALHSAPPALHLAPPALHFGSAGAPVGSAGAPFGSVGAPFGSAGAPLGSAISPFDYAGDPIGPLALRLARAALYLDPRLRRAATLLDVATAASWPLTFLQRCWVLQKLRLCDAQATPWTLHCCFLASVALSVKCATG